MSALSLKARLVDFIEQVWNQGDAAAAPGFLAPLYTLHHDPGDPWEGRTLDPAGFVDRLIQSRAPFPDQRFDIRHACEDGDAVAIAWLWTGTHLGDVPGFAATGKVIRFSGATTYLFSPDGRLTGHWQVTDRLAVFRQLQS